MSEEAYAPESALQVVTDPAEPARNYLPALVRLLRRLAEHRRADPGAGPVRRCLAAMCKHGQAARAAVVEALLPYGPAPDLEKFDRLARPRVYSLRTRMRWAAEEADLAAACGY